MLNKKCNKCQKLFKYFDHGTKRENYSLLVPFNKVMSCCYEEIEYRTWN